MFSRQIILTFHGLGSPPSDAPPEDRPYWVDVNVFEQVLDLLTDASRQQVTFDDGFVSDYDVAYARLRERGMTGVFFVLAGRIDQSGSLSGRQIREMADAGMVFGNHGMDHRSWRSMDKATAHRELVESRDRLEQIVGRPVTLAACPLGQYDRRSLAQLYDAGYERVHTSDRGWTSPGRWLASRNTVTQAHTPADIADWLENSPGVLAQVAGQGKQWIKRWR